MLGRPWSLEDLGLLYNQWEAGLPLARLAEQFDRSVRAVRIKLNAAGYQIGRPFVVREKPRREVAQDMRFQERLRAAGYRAYTVTAPGTERPVFVRAGTCSSK